jgi:hypothetical protein
VLRLGQFGLVPPQVGKEGEPAEGRSAAAEELDDRGGVESVERLPS